jgi:GAF domain-containing protein
MMYDFVEQIETIVLRHDTPVATRMDNLLEYGILELGAEVGVVSQIRGDVYRISRSILTTHDQRFRTSEAYRLNQTYGSIVVAESGLVAIECMRESAYRSHLCYRTFQLESYIAVPLIVNGNIFGALEFGSHKRRKVDFHDMQTNLMYMMGGSLAEMIEQDMRLQVIRATSDHEMPAVAANKPKPKPKSKAKN